MEDAYEQANAIEVFGGSTAHESALQYGVTEDGVPPAGAFVFYDCVGTLREDFRNWGHVGLALPDGMVIHAWNAVRVDPYLAIPALAPPPGWTAPVYVGWVPLARILIGFRPRNWLEDTP